jgi:hypothetical protein
MHTGKPAFAYFPNHSSIVPAKGIAAVWPGQFLPCAQIFKLCFLRKTLLSYFM